VFLQTWHVPPRMKGIHARSVSQMTVQKPKKPSAGVVTDRKRTITEGIKSSLYNALQDPLGSINLPQPMCPYFDSITPPERPQFSQLWNSSATSSLVPCKFGSVCKGSVLSYQMPPCNSDDGDVIMISGVEPPPPFVLPDHSSFLLQFLPVEGNLANHYNSLFVCQTMCRDYEQLTRSQSATEEWHRLRKNRITSSNFKKVCCRRGNFESLASTLLSSRSVTTAAMKYGLDNEPVAAETYGTIFGRNVYRVGLVLNPSCFFLGASPDRRVFDPDVTGDPWGLLEIKCTMADSVTDCDYLAVLKNSQNDFLQLKCNHDYFYQIMGQMGLTGANWCDFFCFCQE
jgi:hypothetical protein